MHGLMMAIEYSYKLDGKNYFNLWCELGRLLLRQSQILLIGNAKVKNVLPLTAKEGYHNAVLSVHTTAKGTLHVLHN